MLPNFPGLYDIETNGPLNPRNYQNKYPVYKHYLRKCIDNRVSPRP
jgi:hypothetical protein